MKKFWNDFKEFAFKGSMMNLAVGMIIGAAFTAIVNSLVDDLVNPVIGIFTRGIDFSNLFVSLNGQQYDSLEAAEAAGAAVFKYGAFISSIITFLITAIVVFILVKVLSGMQKGMKKPEEEKAQATKTCPYCQSEINVKATRCPNCTSILKSDVRPAEMVPDPAPAAE